ncbi:UNVERIFIED_CONTAM: hypothetical protein ABIC26_004561 [Paenibacillus sp. PvR008]
MSEASEKHCGFSHLQVWRKVKKDWDKTFSTIPVRFSTDIQIEDYGSSNTTAGLKTSFGWVPITFNTNLRGVKGFFIFHITFHIGA